MSSLDGGKGLGGRKRSEGEEGGGGRKGGNELGEEEEGGGEKKRRERLKSYLVSGNGKHQLNLSAFLFTVIFFVM